MTILVTGATGNVGRALVRELLDAGRHVRAVTRDRDRGRRLLGDRPEIVAADLTDRDALERAMAGVDRVFLACGNHPEQVDAECTVVDAAAACGADRLVKLSGPSPDEGSDLVVERWHAQVEQHLAASGLASVALRPASFMTNLLALAEPVATSGVLPVPADGARVAFVDPGDVGALGAALLVRDAPLPSAPVPVTGPAAVSYVDVATAIGAATGRAVRFVPVSEESAAAAMRSAGVPEVMIDVVLAVYRQQRSGAFAQVGDAVPALLHRPARDVAAFVADHRGLFGAQVTRAVGR